jgi:hypothetical protein
MKKTLFVLILLLFISCIVEPGVAERQIRVANQTTELVTLKIKNQYDQFTTYDIKPNTSSQICIYTAEGNFGSLQCDMKAMELRFPNKKGYKCSNEDNVENTFCFSSDRNLLLNKGYKEVDKNTFEFNIIQEDFTNAYTIPD